MDIVLPENSAADFPEPEEKWDGKPLSKEQVMSYLPRYVDNQLSEALTAEIDQYLMNDPECELELQRLIAEEEMLKDAFSDLRPSKSFRGRVAIMCEDVHDKAEHVANSLPEVGWAIFRYLFALLSAGNLIAFHYLYGSPLKNDSPFAETALSINDLAFFYWSNIVLFIISLVMITQGKLIAKIKYAIGRLIATNKKEAEEPTRLEIFMLHVLGILGILVTLSIQWFGLKP